MWRIEEKLFPYNYVTGVSYNKASQLSKTPMMMITIAVVVVVVVVVMRIMTKSYHIKCHHIFIPIVVSVNIIIIVTKIKIITSIIVMTFIILVYGRQPKWRSKEDKSWGSVINAMIA